MWLANEDEVPGVQHVPRVAGPGCEAVCNQHHQELAGAGGQLAGPLLHKYAGQGVRGSSALSGVIRSQSGQGGQACKYNQENMRYTRK